MADVVLRRATTTPRGDGEGDGTALPDTHNPMLTMTTTIAQAATVTIQAGRRVTLARGAHDGAAAAHPVAAAATAAAAGTHGALAEEELKKKQTKQRLPAFFFLCCCALAAAAALLGGLLGGLRKAADTAATPAPLAPRLAISVFFTLPFVGGTAGDVLDAPGWGGGGGGPLGVVSVVCGAACARRRVDDCGRVARWPALP
jgi:hypothetical protein